MAMILGVDLGGTWTRWAKVDENGVLHEQGRARTESYRSLLAQLQGQSEGVVSIGIGLAGPVIDQQATLTNLGWDLCAKTLTQHLDKTTVLMNDLGAVAAGLPYLQPDDYEVLQPGSPEASGVQSVVAVGTGLGQSFLVPAGEGRWIPCPSEGGHCDFAPGSEVQDKLSLWMRKKLGHVSWERLISGHFGFKNLYDFLVLSEGYPKLESDTIDGRSITGAAADAHPTGLGVIRLMVELLGVEAGNLALKTLSMGGVWIAGGVAPRLLPWLKEDAFLTNFADKGRFSSMVQKIPVRMIHQTEDCALKGAAAVSRDIQN